MGTAERTDPVRSTLVAILQQLNRAEAMHEGRAGDQSLELAEIQRSLDRFWAVEHNEVKIPLVLGLLVRNGLVEVRDGAGYHTAGTERRVVCYHITADGKKFLVDALEKTDRIS